MESAEDAHNVSWETERLPSTSRPRWTWPFANLHTKSSSSFSVQWIVIFPTYRNRNRFAEQTSVNIGIEIVCDFQNLRIWIGIVLIWREIFKNYLQIQKYFVLYIFFLIISCSWLMYIFHLKKITLQTKPCCNTIFFFLHINSMLWLNIYELFEKYLRVE